MSLRRKSRAFVPLLVAALLAGVVPAYASSSSPRARHATAASASKSTITVGTAISVNSPILDDVERKQAIEAAISSINAAGGINGHKVKLDFCDTEYSSNQELICARQLISDKVVAVINPDFLADQTGRPMTLLAQAGIPIVGDSGLTPAGLTSKDSFPIAGGIPGWSFGAIDNLLKAGATKVALVQDTVQSSQFAVALMSAALAEAKLKPVVTVTADSSSDPTFATAAAQATAHGVNGIAVAGEPPEMPKLIEAFRQAGFKGPISTLSALLPLQSIQAMGSSADGILLSSQTAPVADTSDPGVAAFLADMKKYQPGAELNEDAETGWAAMELFAKATVGLSSFTPKTIARAMNNIKTPISLGIVAPYKTVGATSPTKEFPRILSPTIWYEVVQNGKVVAAKTRGAQDPWANLAHGK